MVREELIDYMILNVKPISAISDREISLNYIIYILLKQSGFNANNSFQWSPIGIG